MSTVNLSLPVADILGDGYQSIVVDTGTHRATLVRHRAAAPTGRAVLYVHGFVDYFFQTELAEFHAGLGADFYALDLHGYGRSIEPGEIAYRMGDVADYYDELDAAVDAIAADGHSSLTMEAHSTGGLIVPMWLAARGLNRANSLVVDSIILNSPFLEINSSPMIRAVVGRVVETMSGRRPDAVLPLPDAGIYSQSIHTSAHGEWDYDLNWKPLSGVGVRVGWLAAVRRAQLTLAGGLGLTCPILVLCSSRTIRAKAWSPSVMKGDAVLDAGRIADLSTRLGPHVTCVRVKDALHDVFLSPAAVRKTAYAEVTTWLGAYT